MTATAEERARDLNNGKVMTPGYNIGNGYASDNREPVTELLVDPVDFDDTYRVKLMTSIDLCKVINSLFIPTCKDYYGCTLGCDPANPMAISLSLYFCKGHNKKAEEGAIDNLIPIAQKPEAKSSIVEKINHINNTNRPYKLYKLSEATQEILLKFVNPYDKLVDRKTGKEKLSNGRTFDNVMIETTEQNGYGYGYNVVDVIHGFNPIAAIIEYYGKQSPAGEFYQYQLQRLTPIRPQGMPGSNVNNYLVSLTQLNMARLDDLWKKAGYSSTVMSQLPIVRI